MKANKPKLIHARFHRYDNGQVKTAYDHHRIGLKTIVAMAQIVDNNLDCGLDLDGVIVNHHKGDVNGHKVHVAATQEQWDAVKAYLFIED